MINRMFVLPVALMLASATAAQTTSVPATPAAPTAPGADNDGTDPTKPLGQIRIAFEHLNLRSGFASDKTTIEYTRPFGDGTWSLRPWVSFGSVNVPGYAALDLGDVSLKLTKILERNAQYGVVTSLEVVAPTAGKTTLGGGKWVAKPNLTYAMFLEGGHIFAPTLLHNVSFAGDNSRAPINLTTLDFYFVPRLANRKLFMTIDPAINHDWESSHAFGALAVTMGYKLGPMLGGRGQVALKPSIGIGTYAPQDWGLLVSFQLLGI